MRILVTGGCGFIGSHLVDRLVADGHAVTALDNLSTGRRELLNPRAQLVQGDVTDAPLVQSLIQNSEAVFHLAAVTAVEACTNDWLDSHRTNVTGTITVFEAAAKAGRIPVVYASSAAVYGDNPDLPLDEKSVTQPISSYGLDKLTCEYYARVASEFHQVPNVGLRFFNVYGPRQDPKSPYSGVITKFVTHVRAGLPLTFFGDGEQTRDFIYVSDVVELLLKALAEAKGARVYNGCTGHAINLKQLAKTIGEAAGKPITTQHVGPKAGDIKHSLGNPNLAMSALGFNAKMTLIEGLRTLLAADA